MLNSSTEKFYQFNSISFPIPPLRLPILCLSISFSPLCLLTQILHSNPSQIPLCHPDRLRISFLNMNSKSRLFSFPIFSSPSPTKFRTTLLSMRMASSSTSIAPFTLRQPPEFCGFPIFVYFEYELQIRSYWSIYMAGRFGSLAEFVSRGDVAGIVHDFGNKQSISYMQFALITNIKDPAIYSIRSSTSICSSKVHFGVPTYQKHEACNEMDRLLVINGIELIGINNHNLVTFLASNVLLISDSDIYSWIKK